MAIIINEDIFIRGGGHSPADCVLYGTFTGDNSETEIILAPGNPTNTKIADGSSAMRQLRFISFYANDAGPIIEYPVAVKSFDQTLQRDLYTITVPEDRVWAFKLDGVDNGLAPVVP